MSALLRPTDRERFFANRVIELQEDYAAQFADPTIGSINAEILGLFDDRLSWRHDDDRQQMRRFRQLSMERERAIYQRVERDMLRDGISNVDLEDV